MTPNKTTADHQMTIRRLLLALIFITPIVGAAGYFWGLHTGRSEAIEGGAEALLAAARQNVTANPATTGPVAEDMARRKTQQGRVQSAQRLNEIGKAMKNYNLAHPDGPMPMSLDELAKDQHLGSQFLVSPVTGKKFVLIPKAPNAPAAEVLAYDDLLPDGGNLLFADGHVEWDVGLEFKRIVSKGGN